MFRTLKMTAALTATLLAVVQPAIAAPGNDTVMQRVEVFYGDLNLNADAGSQAILQRLNVAATKACGGRPKYSVEFAQVWAKFQACRAIALDSAVAAIDQPSVTAAYRESVDSNAPPRIARQ